MVFGHFEDGEETKGVCLLAVNYSFQNDPSYKREGCEVDLRNLKHTFGESRGCNMQVIHSPSRDQLLNQILNENELLRLFNIKEMPSVMILFVMSHGDSKGVVLTDTKSDSPTKSFETFTTAEVLAKLSKWEQCLKMIFFCPCRGDLTDNEESSQRTAVSVSTILYLQNIIIAYSSVEYTKALRNVTRGSLFVEKTCDVFNNLFVDTPVENVLVSIQNAMQKDHVNSQTPEIVYSVHRQLIVHKWISSSSSSDASPNTKNMITKERAMFFNWCSDECQQIRGRWAAVFGDAKQSEVGNIVHALRDRLSFDTTVVPNSFESLDSVGNKTRGEPNNVGCFLACFFAKLSVNEQNAICVEVGSSGHYTVGEIVGKLTGPDNSRWIGRPKIFIFLHQHNTLDCAVQDKKFEIQATRSSGTLVCILNCKDAAKDFTKCLCDQRLKNGSNLQEMMLRLIRKYNNNVKCTISSQLTSTMHFQLDFPDWPVIFIEPSLSVSTTHGGSYEDVSFDALQKDYLIQLYDKKSKMKLCFVSAKIGAGKSALLREIAEYLKKEGKDVYTVDLSRQRANFQNEHLLKLQYLLKISGDICYDKTKSVILFDGIDAMVKEFPNQMDYLFSQMLTTDASIVIATSHLQKRLFMQKLGLLEMMWVYIKPLQKVQRFTLLMKASARSALDCNLLLNKLNAFSGLLQSPEFIMFISDSFDTTPSKLVEKFHRKKLEFSVITKGGFDQRGENFKSIVDDYERILQNCAQQFLKMPTNKYTFDDLQINVLNSTGIVTVQEDGKAVFQYKVGAKFIAAQRFLMDMAENKCKDTLVHKLPMILIFVDKILADYNAEQKEQLIENFKKYRNVNYIFKSAVSKGLENIFELLKNLFTFGMDQPDKIFLSDGFLYLALAHNKSKPMTNSLFEMNAYITPDSAKVPVKKIEELAASEDVHKLKTIKDSITSVRNENKTVLLFATERHNRSFMKFLINKGIQINVTDAMEWTSLHVAVENADLKTIKFLLRCDGTLIKRRTKTGLTCFHIAASYANVETCEFLINKGVHFNKKDNFGNNALHFAAMAGKDAIVNLLLNDLEFDVNGKSNDGLTALHYAASEGQHRLIRSLLTLGADQMAMTLSGWNALHFAVRYAGVETVRILTQDLVTNDIINIVTTDGYSLFHLAACNDGIEILKFLLTQGDVFLGEDKMGWNLLHFACRYNNFAIVKWLMMQSLVKKDFVNKVTRNSATALVLAAQSASVEICKLLVENGATVCHVDVSGNTAITYAFDAKRFKLVEFLVSKASFYDIFISTASRLLLSVVSYILQRESRVNEVNEKNEIALFYAVKNNNYEATEMLIQNGADVNHKNVEGWTPLMMAAENAHYNIFDLLIKNEALIHWRNNSGKSVLHMTCKTGNLVATTRLLNSKLPLDINSEDNKRRTALYVAAQHKHEQIVQLLLANGANVNRGDHTLMTPSLVAAGKSFEVYKILEKNKIVNLAAVDCYGKNALHLASEHGNEKVVRHLLNLNYTSLSVSDKDKCWGRTALHYAAANGWVEIAKLLIASGANVDAKDFNSSTPLSMAAKFSSLKMLEYLVQSGATLGIKDAVGDNALHCAATGGKFENVCYLVKKKTFSTKQKGRDGGTVLHFSVIANNLSITKLLLGLKGTDINARDKNDDTPLLLAAKYTNVEMIEYLLEKNAELNAKNKIGDSALHCAVLGGKMDIVKYFFKINKCGFNLKNKKKRTTLHHAVLVGNLQIAEFLFTDLESRLVTINARDKNGLTPLLMAKKVEMMKLLIINGANLDAFDNDGKTALHINSLSGNIDIVKYLIRIKPDLVKQSSKVGGVTALHEASSRGFVQVAELLIKGGADVNARSHSLRTPLMFAASVEMCDLLVQNKSHPNCEDCHADTALHFACRNGKLDIVKYLVEHDYHLLNINNNFREPPESNACCKINEEVQNYIRNVRQAHHETPCNNASCVVR